MIRQRNISMCVASDIHIRWYHKVYLYMYRKFKYIKFRIYILTHKGYTVEETINYIKNVK